MNFYPFNDIETISPRPMLFISGDQAHSKEFSEEAYRLAGQPKELYWVTHGVSSFSQWIGSHPLSLPTMTQGRHD